MRHKPLIFQKYGGLEKQAFFRLAGMRIKRGFHLANIYLNAVSKNDEFMGFFAYQKKDRLLKRHEFTNVSRNGTKLFNQHFIAMITPTQKNHSRLGITTSKKVGTAAARNRIKRLCREYFRLNRYKIEGNWDINLIAKNMAADVTPEQVLLSLQDIFDRIARGLNH